MACTYIRGLFSSRLYSPLFPVSNNNVASGLILDSANPRGVSCFLLRLSVAHIQAGLVSRAFTRLNATTAMRCTRFYRCDDDCLPRARELHNDLITRYCSDVRYINRG